MPKVLFQAYLSVDQYNYIEQKSKETNRSKADIVREIIEEYLKEKEKKV